MNSKKVLLIDDNNVIRIYLKAYFKTGGWEFHAARDGLEGLPAAEDLEPDLILVQGKLPDMSGMSLIGKIRKINSLKNVPVIFYTGSQKEKSKYRWNPPAASHYLYSPYDYARLHDIITKDIFPSDEEAGEPEIMEKQSKQECIA